MAKPKSEEVYYPNTLIRKRNRELEQERQEEKQHRGKPKEENGVKEESVQGGSVSELNALKDSSQ